MQILPDKPIDKARHQNRPLCLLAYTIRDEQPTDVDAIAAATEDAFLDSSIPGERNEHLLAAALRQAGGLAVSLVADLEGEIIGHIAFSPITINDHASTWYSLAPVSVVRRYQLKGIGTALINQGLDRLRSLGAGGCILVGHPSYYPRFGFVHPGTLLFEGVPAEAFFGMSYTDTWPQGRVREHPGLEQFYDW